jgi:hypothetical protein
MFILIQPNRQPDEQDKNHSTDGQHAVDVS